MSKEADAQLRPDCAHALAKSLQLSLVVLLRGPSGVEKKKGPYVTSEASQELLTEQSWSFSKGKHSVSSAVS